MVFLTLLNCSLKTIVSPKGSWFQVSVQQIKMKHHNSLRTVPVIDLQVTPYAIARELTQFIQTLSSEHQVRPRSDIQITSPGQKDHPPPRESQPSQLQRAFIGERKKNVDRFSLANSTSAFSDCLALIEFARLGVPKC